MYVITYEEAVRIRELLESGMSRQEVADVYEVARETIAKIARGETHARPPRGKKKTDVPDYSRAKKVAPFREVVPVTRESEEAAEKVLEKVKGENVEVTFDHTADPAMLTSMLKRAGGGMLGTPSSFGENKPKGGVPVSEGVMEQAKAFGFRED